MKYVQFTQIPNVILDAYLSELSLSELRVLLVVLRQTMGFVYKGTQQRKKKDWISNAFYIKKTRLSAKSVSLAVARLIDKNLIVALDANGNVLHSPESRQGKKRIYFSYAPHWHEYQREKMVNKLAKKLTI
ncbi:MAG: replication protein [Bacteroidetes bacterium]|nr:replication protein [Bacteroidota bacterium]